MAPRRKVSLRQIILLIEFAEGNRDIALGRFAGGPQASQTAQRAWESIAIRLNAVAEGSTKTPDQWRRYWIEFKAKTKSKAADSRRNASGTGGGPNRLAPLTEAEERVLAIIGQVAVEGLPGVRIPFNVPSNDSGGRPTAEVPPTTVEATSVVDTEETSGVFTAEDPLPELSEPMMEEEWLEDHDLSLPLPPTPTPPVTAAVPIPSASLIPPRVNATSSAVRQRMRSQSRFQRDERVPQWAYNLEEAHIAAQNRLAAAVEQLAVNMDQRLAAIQALLASLIEAQINER